MAPRKLVKSVISLLPFVVQLASQVTAATQFASHVSVNTPARSFTHGVGDPLPFPGTRNYNRRNSFRSLPIPTQTHGYPRERPAIPFTSEDIGSRDNTLRVSPWQYNNYMDVDIAVLPPSPYKVDSADPESLWPEGLLLPSYNPPRYFIGNNRRSEVLSEAEPLDPYLLEGSEAILAVKRATNHGLLYFHDIPHIASLLANQQFRIKNNLKPHRVASIRYTWPFNRP